MPDWQSSFILLCKWGNAYLLSVRLDILSLICINIHYPWITMNLAKTHGFYSIFTQHTMKQQRSFAHKVSLVRRNLTRAPSTLITIIMQSFGSWSIARFNVSWLSWAQQTISTLSWSISEIMWRYTAFVAAANKDYCPIFAAYRMMTSCFSTTERLHTVHATLSLTCTPMFPTSLNWKSGRQTVQI